MNTCVDRAYTVIVLLYPNLWPARSDDGVAPRLTVYHPNILLAGSSVRSKFIQYQRTNIVIGRANLVITVPAMAIRRLTIASGKRRAIDESSPR